MASLGSSKDVIKLSDLPATIREQASRPDQAWKFQQILDELKAQELNDVVVKKFETYAEHTFSSSKNSEKEAVYQSVKEGISDPQFKFSDPRKILKAAKSRKALRKLIKDFQSSSDFKEQNVELLSAVRTKEDGTLEISDEKSEEMEKEMREETLGEVTSEMILEQLEKLKSKFDIKTQKYETMKAERMIQKFIQSIGKEGQKHIHVNLKDKGTRTDTPEFYTQYFSPLLVRMIQSKDKSADIVAITKEHMKLQGAESLNEMDFEYFSKEVDGLELDRDLLEKAYKVYLAYNPFLFLDLLDGLPKIEKLELSEKDQVNQEKFYQAVVKLNAIQERCYNEMLSINFKGLIKIFGMEFQVNWKDLNISDKMTVKEVIAHLGNAEYKALITRLFQNTNFVTFNEATESLAALLDGIEAPTLSLQFLYNAFDKADLPSTQDALKTLDFKSLKKELSGHPRKSDLLYLYEKSGKLEETLGDIEKPTPHQQILGYKWLKGAKSIILTGDKDDMFRYDFVKKTCEAYQEMSGEDLNSAVELPRKRFESNIPPFRIQWRDERHFHEQEKDMPRVFRKVTLTAYGKDFGLSLKAMMRFKNICQHRFCEQNDTLTLKSEIYPTKELNEQHCIQLMLELIREAKKADEGAPIGHDEKPRVVPQMEQIRSRLTKVDIEDIQSSHALGIWSNLVNFNREVIDASDTYGLHVKKQVEEIVEELDAPTK